MATSVKMATIATLVAACALSACTTGRKDIGDALGFGLESPSAFNVVPRAPLRLPPDMSELPLPNPGAPSPLDPQPRQAARAALANAGQPDTDPNAPSPGELALLDASGASQADPRIREIIADDVDGGAQSEYGASTLFGLDVPDGTENDILLPREEAQRLEEAGGNAPNPAPEEPEEPSNTITLFSSE